MSECRINATGAAPIAICIQKPSHPSRENVAARLLLREGFNAFLIVRNIDFHRDRQRRLGVDGF
jgi:hypothetical protein